jgi:hypothetical protein
MLIPVDRAAEDDEALLRETVHEDGVLIPTLLLTQTSGLVPGPPLGVLYQEVVGHRGQGTSDRSGMKNRGRASITTMGFLALVVVAALAIAAFFKLSDAAAAGAQGARLLVVLESLALLVSAGMGLLVALVFLALRCDENCDEGLVASARGGHWWDKMDAWQWYAQFGVVLAGSLAVGAAFVLTLRRRYDLAPRVLLAGAACFLVWAVFLSPLGDPLEI